MDNGTIMQRLAQLHRGEFQEDEFFCLTYNIPESSFAVVGGHIDKWAPRFVKGPHREHNRLSRWVFEAFFERQNLLPPRLAANWVGVEADSLKQILRFAEKELGVPDTQIGIAESAIRRDFISNIHEYFPALRHTLFSDHTSYCLAIHEALKQEGIAIVPAYDRVAQKLEPDDPDLSHSFDIVSLEPIGLRHSVWINFGKPFAFEPDKVSVLTYVRYRQYLQDNVPSYYSIDHALVDQVERRLDEF